MEYIQRWAGAYTIISCCHWGKQYKKILERDLGLGFDHVVFICRKGTASFFVSKEEFERFGKTLAKRVEQDDTYAIKILDRIKFNTDKIISVMSDLEGKIPTKKEFETFLKYFENHISLHNFMKKTPDFLSEDLIEKHIDIFRDARKYSEPVYTRTEEFFRSLAKAIGEKEDYRSDILTALTDHEIKEYIRDGKLPPEEILEVRYNKSALIFENGSLEIKTWSKVDDIEREILGRKSNKIRGECANKGRIRGVARIVLDPFEPGTFNEGDILVTGMTRPEFMPLSEKAGAIVTDVGGKLCHAAITSRELNIPCIIDTKIATKVFKDGDQIEVDAYEGVVRKLQ